MELRHTNSRSLVVDENDQVVGFRDPTKPQSKVQFIPTVVLNTQGIVIGLLGPGGQVIAIEGGGVLPGQIEEILDAISALNSALANKSNVGHGHDMASITGLVAALNGKQAVLVSGESLRSINGISLLGSGNIDIDGTGGGGPVAIEDVEGLQDALDGKVNASDAEVVGPGAGDIEMTDTIVVMRSGSPSVTRTMTEMQDLLIGDFLDFMDGML